MEKRYRRKRKRKRPKFGILLLIFAALFYLLVSDKSATDEETSYYKEQLQDLLHDYPEVQTILDNIKLYPQNILELAIHNQETISFVVNYIDYTKYGNQDEKNISIDNYVKNEIPLFLQWDTKWGYYQYGNGLY